MTTLEIVAHNRSLISRMTIAVEGHAQVIADVQERLEKLSYCRHAWYVIVLGRICEKCNRTQRKFVKRSGQVCYLPLLLERGFR